MRRELGLGLVRVRVRVRTRTLTLTPPEPHLNPPRPSASDIDATIQLLSGATFGDATVAGTMGTRKRWMRADGTTVGRGSSMRIMPLGRGADFKKCASGHSQGLTHTIVHSLTSLHS